MALLSTAVKVARRINLSPVLKQWPSKKCHRDLSTAVKQWRRVPQWSTNKCRSIHSMKELLSANTSHDFGELGYTDVADLLSTPERDFLVRNNGEKVPISSLKGKLVGLYFCENVSYPPRMEAVKEVYEEAKSRGYDFEIVQITFHYPCSNAEDLSNDPTVQWLTLPFMNPTDPSCRKIQRIFECVDDKDGSEREKWVGDSLVLVHPRQAEDDDSNGVLFEFSGAEILKRWGIEGYPFTRPSLYKVEYERQKREVTLKTLFYYIGKCLLRRRPAGDGFDLVDAVSQLSGKRVLVWVVPRHDWGHNDYFASTLKSEYEAQVEDNVAEESRFEVVYVSTNDNVSSFDRFTKDMPGLVWPFSLDSSRDLLFEFFNANETRGAVAAAFNEQGELIAKERRHIGEKKEGDKLRFPFIDPDLEKKIREEVDEMCDVVDIHSYYYFHSTCDSDSD